MPLTVGSRLGHYDVTALIGEGGMGQVCQATDTTLGCFTAFKAFGLSGPKGGGTSKWLQRPARLWYPGLSAYRALDARVGHEASEAAMIFG